MGLDMYLTGVKYLPHNWQNPERDKKVDGFRLEEIRVQLGEWRKHPDLHGYIVKNFADGKDNCQEMDLVSEQLEQILHVVEMDNLPHTEGFFFGASYPEDKQPTINILKDAIKWINKPEANVWKSVVYRASW